MKGANDGVRIEQPALQLWGGVECTINRVDDTYFNQLQFSGHDERVSDLEQFATLGFKAMRYPLLWEFIAPDKLESANWQWASERLNCLRKLNIEPIIGLIHHGSGPRHTNLLDPHFPALLAEYAAAVAQRFPWATMYTPVNEPLTTARFSGLYGIWYPHARDDCSFVRALIHQCKAIVLAMREIRRVNSQAQLIQTDDLGKSFATPELRYQGDFENERRWLAFDLLCGRVVRDHPLWDWLRYVGVRDANILWFADNPCPPDIFGFNYYITSERFLDDRLEMFPEHLHGGNGQHRYVDVEAVRARPEGIAGPYQLLREAWQRYRKPMAVTEVQLACHPDEQIRWFWEVWNAAQRLREEGADVRAVTAWALLGAFDWDCLVRECRGCYEPGAFELRDGQPQPTPLAEFLKTLARGEEPDLELLHIAGWWRRPERLLFCETAGSGM